MSKKGQIKSDKKGLVLWSRKKWTKRKKIVLFLVVIAFIILCCSTWWVLAKTDWIIKHEARISVEDQASLFFEEAVTYNNNGQLDEALSFALKADVLNPTDNIEDFIARIYTVKGDNQKAIIYYQKAINNINQEDPMADSYKEDYEKMIQFLSGNIQQEINE